MRLVIFCAWAVIAALGSRAPASSGEQPANQLRQGFDLAVHGPPARFRLAGRDRLSYELLLTNHSHQPLDVLGVEILDWEDGSIVGVLEGEAYTRVAQLVGDQAPLAVPGRVEPGRVAIVYIDIALPAGRGPVRSIVHRLLFGSDGRAVVTGGSAEVAATRLPVLGPPLRGGPWAAVYDPALVRGHRRVVYAVAGRARIPGRFAIDWMSPDAEGARGRGAEVLAVADATVIGVKDGVEEPQAGAPRPPVSMADASGNYIALDLENGQVAFYEHLAPGIGVAVGDRVRKGQAIGRLGSTGQASRPHLHFHVADANSLLDAEGVPYVLTGATVVGRYPDIRAADEGGPWEALPEARLGEGADHLPPPNAVVRFD